MNSVKREVANTLSNSIGGSPKVISYHDDNNDSQIDIYIGKDRPQTGVSSYGTIGLSEYSIGMKLANNKEVRVEFIGACASGFELFPNILSSAAFNIINDNYSCEPGTVYPNLVSEYYPDSELKHILFTTPFLWDGLNNIETRDKIITWLMAIPISDSEFDYLKQNGSEALEDLFEENEIDVFDLGRAPIV